MNTIHEHNTTATERAVAIIIRDNKLLIFHRIKDGEEYYSFPGGSVEDGETREEAAVRELQEEMCIDIKIDKLLFSFYVSPNKQDHGRTSYFFLVTEFSGTPELGGPEKERMNDDNQFYVYWLDLDKLEETKNLYPEEARERLIEYLKKN